MDEERETAQLPASAPGPRDAQHALVAKRPEASAEKPLLIMPDRPSARLPIALAPSAHRRAKPDRMQLFVRFAAVAVIAVVVLGFTVQHLYAGKQVVIGSTTPGPSGRGPWTTLAESKPIVPAPPPGVALSTPVISGQGSATSAPFTAPPGGVNALEPCHDATMFLPTITQWSVPPGCYSQIYKPNPANYVQRPGFGYCNWWVRVTHPDHPDITENMAYPRGSTPVPGAAVFFDGNEQGALSEGHWAKVVGVDPDHYWVLISEMNFAWRGGGFGLIDYRYIHVSPGVHFVYIYS